MANKVVLVALLALASVAIADRHLNIPPVMQRMMDTFPKPEVPEDYVSTNPHTIGYYFRSRVDHFDPQNRDTFQFEYFSNDQYYQPGGPIFIFVGGDWPLTPYYIEYGHFRDIANRENAWLFANEHRYYGNSFPVPDLTSENLRFLSVEQAMVDLADWIFHLRNNVVRDPNARVILCGTGYAGALGTWARQRYPHLIDGVWVSSGKMEARFNFKEYAEGVGELLRDLGDDECYGRIWRGFRTAQNLMDAGLTTLVTDMFNTCEPVDPESMLDVETFFFNVKAAVQDAVLDQQNIASTAILCDSLANSTETTDMETIAAWLQDHYYWLSCMPFDFNSHVAAFRETVPTYPENAVLGLRQRIYQFCTQFGWFLTADSHEQPFGYRVTMLFFLNFCSDVFGEWLTSEIVADGVHLTNIHFGAKNPRISSVLFTNGALDPLRSISITEYLQPRSNALVIPGYFNSPDLASMTGYDSPALLQVKYQVNQYVTSWLYEGITPYEP